MLNNDSRYVLHHLFSIKFDLFVQPEILLTELLNFVELLLSLLIGRINFPLFFAFLVCHEFARVFPNYLLGQHAKKARFIISRLPIFVCMLSLGDQLTCRSGLSSSLKLLDCVILVYDRVVAERFRPTLVFIIDYHVHRLMA